MGVDHISERIQEESKKDKEREEAPDHDIKNLFLRVSIKQAGKEIGDEKSHRQNCPDLDEGDNSCSGFISSDNKGIFCSLQKAIVKAD